MITIKLDIDELAGCEIKKDGKSIQFEQLPRQEQIYVCNTFAQFYNLFTPCIKEDVPKS